MFRIKEMYFVVVIYAIILFLALPSPTGDVSKKLPPFLNLVRYGCKTNGPIRKMDYGDPLGREREVWVTTCWAEHRSPFDKKALRNWSFWLSDRDDLESGNKDAMKWMKRVKRASYRWKLEQKVKIVEPEEKKE